MSMWDDLTIDELVDMLEAAGVSVDELLADMLDEYGVSLAELDDDDEDEFIAWAVEHWDL